MNVLVSVLAIIVALAGLVCSIIILIDAFKDAIWKGIVCLLCGLYFLYYALIEFDHPRKWLIVLGALCGGAAGAVLRLSAGAPTP